MGFKKTGCAAISKGYIRECCPRIPLSETNLCQWRTNISATAQVSLPTYPNGTGYIVNPMTIRGSLTKPFSLTPAPIPAPPGASTPNCLANSQSSAPIWTLTQFLYRSTERNPSLPGASYATQSPYNQTLQIELRNNANGVTQSCVFNDPVLDNTTDRWWGCFNATNLHTFPQYTIETYIQFNRDIGNIKVNQTWYCNDTEDGAP